MHEAANVPGRVPRPAQPGTKAAPREACHAPDRAAAHAALAAFAEKRQAERPKAVERPAKDQEALTALLDRPAEHRDHLRTANPVEGVFATIRHRTVRTKRAPSQRTARPVAFELASAASKTWRRLEGENRSPRAMARVTSTDRSARSPRCPIGPRNPDPAIARAEGRQRSW